MKKLSQSQKAKVATASLRLSLKINFLSKALLFLLFLVLPFQFGKHFWPSFSFVGGQRVDYLSPTLYASDLVIVLLFLTTLIKGKFRFGKLGVLGLLGTLLFLALGIFFSTNPMGGWYLLLKLVEFVFVGWIVLREQKIVRTQLFWAFVIGVFLEGFLGILQFFRQGSINGIWYFLGERSFTASTPGIANASIRGQEVLRPYGTFPHPNVFAGYLVVAMLFLLTYAFSPSEKGVSLQKALSGIALIFGTSILFLTLSRVAILIFLLLSIIFLFLKLVKQKARLSRFFYWLFTAGCFLLWRIFISNPLLGGRFFDASSYTESFYLRNTLIQSAWKMFVAHPIIGVGLGNFLTSLPYYISEKLLFGFLQPVHNIFLLVLDETGIIGMAIFVGLLVLAFRNVFQNLKTSKDPLTQFSFLALCAICSIGMTDHYFLTLQQGQLLFSVVLGICFSILC